MPATVLIVLVVAAFVVTLLAAMAPPKIPLWVAVFLLCLIALLQVLPVGTR